MKSLKCQIDTRQIDRPSPYLEENINFVVEQAELFMESLKGSAHRCPMWVFSHFFVEISMKIRANFTEISQSNSRSFFGTKIGPQCQGKIFVKFIHELFVVCVVDCRENSEN